MGFLDSLFGGHGSLEVGNQVLQAYFDEAQKYPEFTYPSYDAWITDLNSKVPDYVTLVGELVNSNSASTTVGQAAQRLFQLANDSGGTASISQIVASAGGKGDTVNLWAAIPEVGEATLLQTATTAATLAQNVGQGTLSTLNLVKYLPWLLGGAAVLYIGVLAKSTGGSVSKLIDAGTETVKSHARNPLRPRKARLKRPAKRASAGKNPRRRRRKHG